VAACHWQTALDYGTDVLEANANEVLDTVNVDLNLLWVANLPSGNAVPLAGAATAFTSPSVLFMTLPCTQLEAALLLSNTPDGDTIAAVLHMGSFAFGDLSGNGVALAGDVYIGVSCSKQWRSTGIRRGSRGWATAVGNSNGSQQLQLHHQQQQLHYELCGRWGLVQLLHQSAGRGRCAEPQQPLNSCSSRPSATSTNGGMAAA